MNDTPFAGGRWTAARYKSFIRSALRKAYMKWPPKQDALEEAREPDPSPDKRRKWIYQCAECSHWYRRSDVQVHHIKEVGNMDDMNGFIGRLFCEENDLQVLCRDCHKKTHGEK